MKYSEPNEQWIADTYADEGYGAASELIARIAQYDNLGEYSIRMYREFLALLDADNPMTAS